MAEPVCVWWCTCGIQSGLPPAALVVLGRPACTARGAVVVMEESKGRVGSGGGGASARAGGAGAGAGGGSGGGGGDGGAGAGGGDEHADPRRLLQCGFWAQEDGSELLRALRRAPLGGWACVHAGMCGARPCRSAVRCDCEG